MGLLDWARRIIGAEPEPSTPQERAERLVRLRVTDVYAQATVGGLTPARYASVLRQADSGYLGPLVQVLRGIEERDLHLQAVLGTRKLSLTGAGWEVTPGLADDPRADDIAAQVGEILRGLPDFSRVLLDLLDGIYQPIAAQEIIWGLDGRLAVPVDLDWVDPARFRYTTSETGQASGSNNLGEIRLLMADGDTTGERLWADKFVLHRPPQRAGYPWQMGLGRGIGWVYTLGAWGLKWWATSTERDAMPFRTAAVADTVSDDDREAIEAGLAALGTQAYAMLPDGVDLTIHETSSTAERYQLYLGHLDALKSKAVLGHTGSADATPGRLGGEDTASGIRQDILEADATALAATIRRDLLGPIVRLNWGPDAPVPYLTFDVGATEDLDSLATRIEVLSRSGLAIPTAWAYDRFGIPSPEPGEDILEAPRSGGGLPFDLGAHAVGNSETVALDASEDEAEITALLRRHNRQAQSLYRSTMGEADDVWERYTADVRHALEGADSYGDAAARLGAMGLDPDIIEPLISEAQHAGWVLGSAQILEEADMIRGVSRTWVPMPPDRAARWLEERGVLDREVWEQASEAIRARSFTAARHEGDVVLRAIQEELTRALDEGTPYDEFVADYHAMMGRLGLTGTDPWHLETIFRTNIQTSLNVGRYQRMTDDAVLELRPFWQYRTVMDGSVRDSHAALNGRIYPAGDPVWGQIYPPNGYNCRCSVVTLSKRQLRGRKVQSEIPPDGAPDPGFESNPALFPADL